MPWFAWLLMGGACGNWFSRRKALNAAFASGHAEATATSVATAGHQLVFMGASEGVQSELLGAVSSSGDDYDQRLDRLLNNARTNASASGGRVIESRESIGLRSAESRVPTPNRRRNLAARRAIARRTES